MTCKKSGEEKLNKYIKYFRYQSDTISDMGG